MRTSRSILRLEGILAIRQVTNLTSQLSLAKTFRPVWLK